MYELSTILSTLHNSLSFVHCKVQQVGSCLNQQHTYPVLAEQIQTRIVWKKRFSSSLQGTLTLNTLKIKIKIEIIIYYEISI